MYVPLAKLDTKKTGYIPLAQVQKPTDYTGTLGEIKSPYSFGMQTSTQAIPDATTPSTLGFVKDIFTGGANTGGGIARNTVLGLPQALKDVLLPGRGYTDAELKAAKPTLAESATGIPRIVAEFSSFLGGLLGSSDSPTLARKFSQTPIGSKLADVGQKITEFGVPKTAGQAQAMRIGDVLTLMPVGSIKISVTAAETIARTKNVKTILGVVKRELPALPELTQEGLAIILKEVDNTDDVQRALNRIEFVVKQAREMQAVKPNQYVPLASRVAPESARTAPITPKVENTTTKAFDASTGQTKIGNFELGSFGKNSLERKTTQTDRFPINELPETQKYITEAYRASDNPSVYRYDNIAWVAKMPDGETRIIYTRQNASGAEEIINAHKVTDPKFIETLKTFGTPDQIRTGIPSLERSAPIPLADGGVTKLSTVSPELQALPKRRVVDENLENLRQEIAISKETLADMPGRELVKYVSPETGELPELAGDVSKTKLDIRGKGRNLRMDFAKRGDDIIQNLVGQELSQGGDVTIAQEMVDAYKSAKAQLTKLENAYREAKIVTRDEKILKELSDKVEQANEKLATLAERFQARIRLENTVEHKGFTKWENVREAMNFPTISNMNAKQFDQLNEVLSQYKTGDEFLPVRQLETIDRTELTGLKTVREVQEHLATKYNLTPAELPGIKPHPWMYDTQLARTHPLYDLLVDKYNVSYLNATSRIIELEKENSTLIKAARDSRPQGIGGKIAPTDKNITEWLEASPETRTTLEGTMTGAELKVAKNMDEVFHEYYDWLSKRSLEKKFESRFEDKYFPHVRRGFLEAWKEDGFLKGLKEQFDQFKQEERMLTILDSKTGDILPYEKWIGFSQFRTGGLVPTQNAARAFKTYITALEKARQFDEFIPEIMIYVHSLSPRGLTARGVELDDSLKRFVKTWINSKKGRVQQQIIKQGSQMDWALRMGVALTRIRDLGLNIPIGIANLFGEQVTNLTMLGAKNYSIGTARLATSKGREITKQYENFVGRTLWEKLSEASNTAGDQLIGGMFGLFGAASRKGNQIFLLGNMTADEFAKGVISTERLAQLRKGMGKYRVVEGAESVFGKSVEGAIGGQYKKWAIPILVSTASNARVLIKGLRAEGLKALKSPEGSELFYTVLVGSTVGLGTMGYYQELKDKKDRNFVEDIIFKSTRDAMTLIGALDPKFIGSFAAPRLASFITDLTEAIDNLLMLERYKTTGELMGVNKLERVLTPSVVTSMIGKDTTATKGGGLPKKRQPGSAGGLPKKRP